MYRVHTSALIKIKINTFVSRYPPAFLLWSVLRTNFATIEGRDQTTPRGCGRVHRSSGRAKAVERSPSKNPTIDPLFLSKLILTPAFSSYLTTSFFTAFMFKRWDTKTVISSAYAETFALRKPALGTPRRATFAPSSQICRLKGSKAKIFNSVFSSNHLSSP